MIYMFSIVLEKKIFNSSIFKRRILVSFCRVTIKSMLFWEFLNVEKTYWWSIFYLWVSFPFLDLVIIQQMMDKFIVNLIFFNCLLWKEIIHWVWVLITRRHDWCDWIPLMTHQFHKIQQYFLIVEYLVLLFGFSCDVSFLFFEFL